MFSLQVLLGRVCTIAGLQSKELPIAVRTVDNAQFDCPSSSQKHEDHVAKSYLQDLLIEISKAGGGELVPVNVEGDGYCLTHAISKFFFGIEIFYHVIRSKIFAELNDNAEWYKGRLKSSCKTTGCSNDKLLHDGAIDVACDNREIAVDESSMMDDVMGDGRSLCPAFTDEEYSELLQAAVPDYADLVEWSPLAHCQALSNILKRPVCLFTSLKDLDRQESFIFIPLRHPCKDCYKHPISVAWQGRGQNGELSHFVPLCRILDSSAPKIPRSCQPAFYRCSKRTGQQYVEYNTDGSFCIGLPVLFAEVQSTHLFKTMGYRFKPHKPDQPGFFHGLIDRLIDSSCQEMSLAFTERGSCAFDSTQNGDNDNHHEDSRSKMKATSLLTKLYVSRIGFNSISCCAASKTKMSLTDSFQTISRDITTTYLNELIKQKKCASYKIAIKLEIDEHVVAGMERIQSTCVARTHYLQYLLATQMKDLISLECEKFLSSLSKNVLSSPHTTATSRDQRDKNCPSSSSSSSLPHVSKEGDLLVDSADPSNDAAAGQVEVEVAVATITSLPGSSDNNNHNDHDENDGILLHLICCKKIAVEYYNDSKKLFIETYMSDKCINSHTNMSETVINDAHQTRIELFDDRSLAVHSDTFSTSKPNISYNEFSEERSSLESSRKRNISDI